MTDPATTATTTPLPTGVPLGILVPAYCVVTFELLVDLAGFPLSALNFYAIWRTSVMHRNLKFILLCQSAAYFMRFLIKLAISMPNRFFIGGGNILWHESQLRPVHFVFFANVSFRHLLGHVIVLERAMATWLAATGYEKRRGNMFSVCWFCFLIAWGLLNTTSQQLASANMVETSRVTSITLICSYVGLLLAFIDIGVFIALWRYNKRNYGGLIHHIGSGEKNEYALTQRYQQLENIRTGLQLVPTLVCHLLYILDSVLAQTFLIFNIFPGVFEQKLLLAVSNMLDALFAFSAELTIIIFHPFLRRDIQQSFFKLIRRNRVEDSATNCRSSFPDGIGIMGGGGKGTTIDEHFLMLKNSWGDKDLSAIKVE